MADLKDMSAGTGTKEQVAAPPPVPAPAVEEPDEPEDEEGQASGRAAGAAGGALDLDRAGGRDEQAGGAGEVGVLGLRDAQHGGRGCGLRWGANGKVKSATPMGLQSGALGGCVAKVAKTAKYPAAREGADFEYTFHM